MNTETTQPPGLANEAARMAWLARLAWLDLFGHLKDACDALNRGGSFRGLQLRPASVLYMEHPSREQVNVLLRCGSGEDYWLRIAFDYDLLYLRFTVEDDPFTHELLAVCNGNQSGFHTREHIFRTAEEAAYTMLMYLIIFKG